MSATGRGAKRIANDCYPTPAWCVHRLLEATSLPGGHWLEPAAGEGAIIRAVNEHRRDVVWSAIDIRETAGALNPLGVVPLVGDFLKMPSNGAQLYDVAISNPPYSDAFEFIETSLRMARHVLMLLRLNFLASERRAAAMRSWKPDVYVLPNRPSFVPSGGKKGATDSTEYAWFHFKHNELIRTGYLSVLATTPKEIRRG